MNNINDKTLQVMDERIDKYLMGEMTNKEELDFLSDVEKDEILRNRARTAALLAKTVKNVMREEESEVFDFLESVKVNDEIVKENGRKEKTAIIIPMWPKVAITAVAAGTCLLFGNRYLLNANTDEFIAGTNVELGIGRGAESNLELSILFENVKEEKDLSNTIDKLNKEFTQLEADEDQDAPTVGWYLAVAYVKDGNKEAAKEVLQRVIALNPKFKDAWKLRDQLNKSFFWE